MGSTCRASASFLQVDPQIPDTVYETNHRRCQIPVKVRRGLLPKVGDPGQALAVLSKLDSSLAFPEGHACPQCV